MTDPWASVVGQERAVAALQAASRSPVHAYLLVGPHGSGKRDLPSGYACLGLLKDPALVESALELVAQPNHASVKVHVWPAQS